MRSSRLIVQAVLVAPLLCGGAWSWLGMPPGLSAAEKKLPAFLQGRAIKKKNAVEPLNLPDWALDGVWHVQLVDALGAGSEPGRNRTKDLNLYLAMAEGRVERGVATAATFNNSVHFLEGIDLAYDQATNKLSGSMTVEMTPDPWIPKDGRSFKLTVNISGKLVESLNDEKEPVVLIQGQYSTEFLDGYLIGGETGSAGSLSGQVGERQTGFENGQWSAVLSQEMNPNDMDIDCIDIRLGIADGAVHWGAVGIAFQPKWPAWDVYPVDSSDFRFADDMASGSFDLTGRHLHPAGDPDDRYHITFTAERVQGLVGMRGVLSRVSADEDGYDHFLGTFDANGQRKIAGRGGFRAGAGLQSPMADQLWRGELDTRPWFTEVADFVAPQAGEHPRLLFRKDDIAELRRQAQTPAGQQIIERLREVIGENGEAVTERFSLIAPHNHNIVRGKGIGPGTFTTYHAAGFGLLYQLTGEQKYADLSRQCVELMLAGKYDIDNRYSWLMPGTTLRCGVVLMAMAYAYDWSYDGWSPEFRQKIALEIQNFDKLTASTKDGYKARLAKQQARAKKAAEAAAAAEAEEQKQAVAEEVAGDETIDPSAPADYAQPAEEEQPPADGKKKKTPPPPPEVLSLAEIAALQEEIGRSVTIETLSGRTGYPAGSNHYGAMYHGTGVAMLAILGDPGVDSALVGQRLAEIESTVPRLLSQGFGDGGYYPEGHPPSRLSAEAGMLQFLHALRVCCGKDYINSERSNAEAVTSRWIYLIGGNGHGDFMSRGTYGKGWKLYQNGVRGSFAFGFGALRPEHQRALKWTYETYFQKFEEKSLHNIVEYPYNAAFALMHWPVDEPAQDPDEVMPRVQVDTSHGAITARNRWQDGNDIMVTHLIENGPRGYYSSRSGPSNGRKGKMQIWAFGQKQTMTVRATGKPTYLESAEDGSFALFAGNALLVDMSGESGADLVVITLGIDKPKPKPPKKSKKGKKGKDGTPPKPRVIPGHWLQSPELTQGEGEEEKPVTVQVRLFQEPPPETEAPANGDEARAGEDTDAAPAIIQTLEGRILTIGNKRYTITEDLHLRLTN